MENENRRHSGFDAPVIGRIIGDDEELVKLPNGRYKIVKKTVHTEVEVLVSEADGTLGKKDKKEKKGIYVTLVGTQFRQGNTILEKGTMVKLVKEPDNDYDREAIRVELKPFGKIGYVANSTKTVIGECYSAGRLYDKIGDKAKAEIVHVMPNGIIARVIPEKKGKKK